MSPFRYQLSNSEFRNEWTSKGGKPMSEATFYRRKSWAQDNYPLWRKVFLFDGRVDLKEYQRFESFFSEKQYEAHEDPHAKFLKKMGEL